MDLYDMVVSVQELMREGLIVRTVSGWAVNAEHYDWLDDITADIKVPSKLESEQAIFDHWNSMGIITHRVFRTQQKFITAALKVYNLAEIREAIQNYGTVVGNPNRYWFSYRWTLKDFLHRGLEKFVSASKPLEVYAKTNSMAMVGSAKPVAGKYDHL